MGTVRIVSREDRPFADREEAGRLLGRELGELRGQHPVVLGIPRGGLVVAREVAREIGGELDIALARKLRAPMNPELAVGAMSERGDVFVDPRLQKYLGLSEEQLEREQERVRLEIEERKLRYRQVREKVSLDGRMVVITDDGLATGATMRSALLAAQHENPALLICAVPVGSEDSVQIMAGICDQVICLRLPAYFGAVGQFYVDFEQTSDEEVLQILQAEQERVAGALPVTSGV